MSTFVTCHRWRSVALERKQLLTYVTVKVNREGDLLSRRMFEEQLRLSDSISLHLRIHCLCPCVDKDNEEQSMPSAQILAAALPRVCDLQSEEYGLFYMEELVPFNMPKLERARFQLMDLDCYEHQRVIHEPTLFTSACNLLKEASLEVVGMRSLANLNTWRPSPPWVVPKEIEALTRLDQLELLHDPDTVATILQKTNSVVSLVAQDRAFSLTPLANLTQLQWLAVYIHTPGSAFLKVLPLLSKLVGLSLCLDQESKLSSIIEPLHFPEGLEYLSVEDRTAKTSDMNATKEARFREMCSLNMPSLKRIRVCGHISDVLRASQLLSERKTPLEVIHLLTRRCTKNEAAMLLSYCQKTASLHALALHDHSHRGDSKICLRRERLSPVYDGWRFDVFAHPFDPKWI